MRSTYDTAIAQIFRDEGGYSNVPGDHGGATNFGITIYDARKYWKADAIPDDMRSMPKSVAAQIYRDHYANPINYDRLPAGVDYALLDYSVNSGIGRSLHVYSTCKTIDAIYDEREAFLKAIAQHPSQEKFLTGWLNRTKRGRKLAHQLADQYQSKGLPPQHSGAGGVIVGGAAAAAQWPHLALFIIPAAIIIAVGVYFLLKRKGK